MVAILAVLSRVWLKIIEPAQALSGCSSNAIIAITAIMILGISKREKIPVASLLMPMGFAALLGGTLTMVGTSSLTVLNDLLEASGRETFNLFSVPPMRSKLVGKSIRDLGLRETYKAQVVRYFSGSEVVEEDIADREIRAGDTLILQGK